jgi:hypothetical protein
VEELFTGTGRADDAGLIVGELAANAIRYTRSGSEDGWFGVEVACHLFARVGVTDLGGGGRLIGKTEFTTSRNHADFDDGPACLPIPELDGVELGGRGLAIVAHLAASTGACGSDALGHHVWADLDITRAAGEPDVTVAS